MSGNIAAIHWRNIDLKDNVEKLINDLKSSNAFEKIIMFSLAGMPLFDESTNDDMSFESVIIPIDLDTIPKQKNFILSWTEQKGFKGFLHVIEDAVAIDKDPSMYVKSLENAMDVLDYSIYFSTITDPCNYVFHKFSPRLTV